MPSFIEIGSPVLEKKSFKGFYHIWAWQPSRSCDLDYLYIHCLEKNSPLSGEKIKLSDSYCTADLCLCFRIGKNPVFS